MILIFNIFSVNGGYNSMDYKGDETPYYNKEDNQLYMV